MKLTPTERIAYWLGVMVGVIGLALVELFLSLIQAKINGSL